MSTAAAALGTARRTAARIGYTSARALMAPLRARPDPGEFGRAFECLHIPSTPWSKGRRCGTPLEGRRMKAGIGLNPPPLGLIPHPAEPEDVSAEPTTKEAGHILQDRGRLSTMHCMTG